MTTDNRLDEIRKIFAVLGLDSTEEKMVCRDFVGPGVFDALNSGSVGEVKMFTSDSTTYVAKDELEVSTSNYTTYVEHLKITNTRN